ncbi:MAG: 23S rRNA (pseudouridine(1915)-N(3))-methyltransferase RlmH [Rhizobiaceae bacterium]
MRISVHAIGRLKRGPERELCDRYFERFARAGPPLGLEFAGLREFAEGRAGDAAARRREEGERLRKAVEGGQGLILLDETGRNLDSRAFAAMLAGLRDEGVRDCVVAIGGPDGHDPELRAAARQVISFGKLTWPHQLARIMLAEQLYRATTILAGHPYHRG